MAYCETVEYEDLQVGMICEDWDCEAGASIVSIERIPRPGFRYDVIRVTLSDGSVKKSLPYMKMNVRH